MAFPTWLYTLKNCLEHCQSQRAGRRRASRRSATGRLHTEQLEVRLVLSATFDGALSIGNGAGDTTAGDVVTDATGNSYMTGYFNGMVDFDEAATHPENTDILTARGSVDTYVAKYAANNSLLWVQQMGGTLNAGLLRSGNLVVDGSGNVYVAGHFLDSADFGSTTLSSAGGVDGFVAKLDAGGTFQWATRLGTGLNDYVAGAGIDSLGNVYTLSHNSAYEIRKFNSTGTAVWSRSIVTSAVTSHTNGLAVSTSGNVFLAGMFTGTVDFDPGAKTYNVTNPGGPIRAGFVLKLDTNGKFGWVSTFEGHATVDGNFGRSSAHSVSLDGSGNVIVGGDYNGSVDFKPGFGTTTLPTIGGVFITKLNRSGGLVWARALEISSSSSQTYAPYVPALAVDTAGSIYATGSFSDTIDLDPGAPSDTRTSAGGTDIFVVKLTEAGNYSWAETFGGTGSDLGFGIAVDPTGCVHLAGLYRNTIDFDPDPLATYYRTTPGIYSNAFRLRLRQV